MNALQNREGGDRFLEMIEKREPIQTIIVDSDEFDRITRNGVGPANLAGK